MHTNHSMILKWDQIQFLCYNKLKTYIKLRTRNRRKIDLIKALIKLLRIFKNNPKMIAYKTIVY